MTAVRALRRVGGSLLDLALPACCAGCGAEGSAICATCRPGLDVRLDLPPGMLLGLPSGIPPPLLQLEWCAPFSGLARRALHQLKYAGERRLAVPLGAALARRWERAGVGGELVVPVPVHRDRARVRGYDQAQLLAAEVARHRGLPMAALLERHRATVAQFELDRADRARNVHGAFRLAAARPSPSARGARNDDHADTSRDRMIRGRWVVLVDDVVTTGATLSACASVLLEAGALAVSAITVARER